MKYWLFLLGKRSEKVGYSADSVALYDAVSWVIYVLKISIFMFKKVHYLFGGRLTFFWGEISFDGRGVLKYTFVDKLF